MVREDGAIMWEVWRKRRYWAMAVCEFEEPRDGIGQANLGSRDVVSKLSIPRIIGVLTMQSCNGHTMHYQRCGRSRSL